jgi:hypothetical protein
VAPVIVVAATTATAPSFYSPVISQTARAVLDGIILGSSAWPSVPIDAQRRLQLFSAACQEEGRCKWALILLIDGPTDE